MLSLGDADDRSPSRIRGIFRVVWLMARGTRWQNSMDLGMTASFECWTQKKRPVVVTGRPGCWVMNGLLGYFNRLVAYRGANSRNFGKGIVYGPDSS